MWGSCFWLCTSAFLLSPARPPARPPSRDLLTHNLSTHNLSPHHLLTRNLSSHDLLTHNLSTCHHTTCSHATCHHTTYSHTTCPHTTCHHTTCSHATCHHTTYSHTTCPRATCHHTTCSHATCHHTTSSHTTCHHTTYSHITCPHTTWSPHNLLTHNLITRQLIHTELVHTQLAWRATWRHGSSLSVAGLALVALGWLWWSIHPELSTPWDHWNHVSLRHPKVSTKILTIIGVILYNTLPYYPTSQGRGLKTPNRTFCTLMVLRFQAGINWMDGSNPWAHFSNHAWNSYLHLFAFSYIVNLSSYSSSMDGWSCGWILSGAPSKIVQVFETKGVLLIWRQFFPLWVLVWISLGQLFAIWDIWPLIFHGV